MLLFIIVKRMIGLHHFEFQYISCYCLSGSVRIHRSLMVISIHLMLLFIGDFVWHRTAAVEFQYISCYCLSYFKISTAVMVAEFQYISCYCLSYWCSSVYYRENKFQYISCYCLSSCSYVYVITY